MTSEKTNNRFIADMRVRLVSMTCLLAVLLLLFSCEQAPVELKKGLYISGNQSILLSENQSYSLHYERTTMSSYFAGASGSYTVDGSVVHAGKVVLELDKNGNLTVIESSDDKVAVGTVFEYAPAYMQDRKTSK